MEASLALISPGALVLAALAAALAGLVKGIVGFAMPMILISALGSFLAPELALAGLIMPTLVTNGMQALRQGWRAAMRSVSRFRVFLAVGLVALLISAQLVRALPAPALFLAIGVPVSMFALLQLAGWRLRLPNGPTPRIEAVVGGFAGFIGGLSGVWGPPTVAYLTAIDTEKTEHIRVQGVIYGLGAVALTLAHTTSGVINPSTLPFSLILVIPAVAGMMLGGIVQDRIDQAAFRRATLLVLLIAGLNLVRRGLMV